MEGLEPGLQSIGSGQAPNMDSNGTILLQTITHLFLPKRTPEAEQPDLGNIEKFILHSVKKTVSQAIHESPFSDDLEGLPEMLEVWELLQPNPNSPQRVNEEHRFVENFIQLVASPSVADGTTMSKVIPTLTVPIYIRKQNCTILIERKEDGSMQLETFRAALPSELVMSSVGPLAMNFPETRDIIQNEGLLTSMVFARSLFQLAIDEIGISIPVQTKSGRVLANLRDVPEPFLISDWIVTVLSPTEKVRASPEAQTICKKIRDQVTLSPVNKSSNLLPFRRSGLWMSIKVAVQLKLLKLFGEGNKPALSKVIYKLLILRVLADLCKKYYEMRDIIKIDLDLAAQMLAKVGGRVMKLQKLLLHLGIANEQVSTSLDAFKTEILEYVELVVGNLHRLMKSYQAMMIADDDDDADDNANTSGQSPGGLRPHSHKSYLNDLNHSIPFLNSYKDEPPSPQKQNGFAPDDNITEDLLASLELKRYVTIDATLTGACSLSEHYSTNERIWLHDTETFMKKYLGTEPHSWKIRQLVQTYVKHGLILYDRNPVGISQMILVVLKAVEVLDMRATQTYPLILDYLPGIASSSFDCLLLPHKDDMKLLDDTLAYFRGRHSHAKKYSGIITGKVNAKSFAVTFASQNPKMMELKNAILINTEERIAERQEKINEARTECNQILQKILEGPPQCSCIFTSTQETRKDGVTRVKSICTSQCNRCKMEYKVTKLRTQFPLFERPLPREELHQRAVVFEALIPQLISDLRDCLAILKFGLLDEPVFDVAQNEIAIEWMGYGNLVKYYLPKPPKPEAGKVIRLGSKCLNTWATCYRNTKTDILTWSDEELVVDNGLQCIYGYLFTEESMSSEGGGISPGRKGVQRPIKTKRIKEAAIPPLTILRKHCSFQIIDMDNSSLYLPLQGYLQSCSHFQNEVIADQSSCHANLTLDEFITFGSIRAGHRIQLRNLYRAIASKVLSLEEEPVLALILQSIWEIGPSDRETGERDTHLDFEEDGFSTAMLNLLEDQLHANETNYSQPLKLIAAVAITVRILEFNESMYGRCYSLLKNWRSIMRNWTRKLEVEMGQITDPSGLGELKKNLLLIRICSALSYNFSGYLKWDQVMKGYEDIVEWFHTITSLNQIDQDEPLSASSVSLSKFMQILLNVGRNVALQLQLEVEVMDNPMLRESLRLFVAEKWSRATEFTPPAMNLVSRTHKNLIQVIFLNRSVSTIEDDYQVFRITFDFILGSFLVNGFPQGYLPVYITHSTIFQRFFRKNVHLRVQRESPVVFSTIGKFQGKRYEFRVYPNCSHGESGFSTLVVVKEIWDDGISQTLLDHQMFSGKFSPSMVKNYTHWLSQDKSVVYFRRIPNRDSDYDRPPEYKLVKIEKPGKPPKWHLHDELNQSYLLSVKSPGFKEVTGSLKRLELNEHINVLLNLEKKLVTAHLPRHNLRFFINPEGSLESLEYLGFCLVTGSDKIQTLIGLQHGVQLKSKFKQVLLLPSGNITSQFAQTEYYFHHLTLIDLEELRQPTYFIYEFDPVLNRLVAKKSKQAWFYLAALNAVTSSPLPDPFTGVTGTEMAVRILQSGFSWSSSPFDEDSLRILKFIRGLAPKRTYYGKKFSGKKAPSKEETDQSKKGEEGGTQHDDRGSMEIIEWKEGLPPMAAYDGFAIIVDKLIEDSERLGPLYYVDKEKKPPGQIDTDAIPSTTLRLRGYFCHLSSYNQAAHVKKDYFSSSILLDFLDLDTKTVKVQCTKPPESFHLDSVVHIASRRLPQYSRVKSEALHPKQKKKKKKKKVDTANHNLLNFLCSEYKPYFDGHPNSMKDIFNLDFRTNWFYFYGMAMQRGKSPEIEHLFTLLLSAMAYHQEDAPLAQILNLHYVSAFAEEVDFPQQLPFPVHDGHQLPLADPSESDVEEMFMEILSSSVDTPKVYNEMGLSWNDYFSKFGGSLRNMAKLLTSSTRPSREGVNGNMGSMRFDPAYLPCINYDMAISRINNLLFQWHWTKQLKRFATDVQNKLDGIRNLLKNFDTEKDGSSGATNRFGLVQMGEVEWADQVHIGELLETEKLNQEMWKDAGKCFRTGRPSVKFNKIRKQLPELDGLVLVSEAEALSISVGGIMKNLTEMIGGTVEIKVMRLAGISPRMDAISLLACLAQCQKDGDEEEGENVARMYAGALAVLWTQMKRIIRCLTYLENKQVQELQLELDNPGHENWSPKEHPEWLLLELDLDIMIRPIQVEVAKQMMKMPGGGNGVMQMNMGEGKTSVIVPMLCSALGKQDEELLCRVTVLPPMFSMNYGILSFAVGGLLNRRIYSIPCRRDMNIDMDCLDMIQMTYKECLEMRGVVLTLPEHRLSFRLLACDNILKKEVELGMELLRTENWLREHVRDVLDESDELLNVKYQLVYTVGEKIAQDGGELRWLTCQRLLKIVQEVGKMFLGKYGGGMIEFDLDNNTRNPHQFTPIRLLDCRIFPQFISTVADAFMEVEGICIPEEKLRIKQFLTQENIKKSRLEGTLDMIKDVPGLLHKILLISGYLRRGVLTLGLSKRWRVEYGVDVTKTFRRMAVPFRAKDVPAERTEFGHPDLAILLTHLSYYYSGLDDQQLVHVIKILGGKQGSEAIYGAWIKQIPREQVPEYLSTFRGLNLKDAYQKSRLFELLRRHKMVIDFWLSNKVFPREFKQFPAKLVMTAWDLCYERGKYPVTGFSGTNDSSILLPPQIPQKDLASLANTNRKVETSLLKPENQGHRRLEMGVNCAQILGLMKNDKLTVLIDAGALMLECNNEEVARLWLELDQDAEAVLYFNQGNELKVMCRSARGQTENPSTPFELSSYQGRLNKCRVFLDDQHTRGTDLKFVEGTRACVTVGGNMKRDKLIQACMRMRKLGFGHSVTFYLSHEAHDKVRMGSNGDLIDTGLVLEWAFRNTQSFNEDGLLYWAIAGRNYAQRLIVEDNFYSPRSYKNFQMDGDEEKDFGGEDLLLEGKANILAQQYMDVEVTTLMDSYGQHIQSNLLVKEIPKWFEGTWNKIKSKNDNRKLPSDARKIFERILKLVLERCQQHVPTKTHFSGSNMEEEQEREMELEKEMEVEEERMNERRCKAKPAQPKLHQNVTRVVVHGETIQIKEGIMRLCDVFKDTTFWGEVQPEGWGKEVFATTDFISVIEDMYAKTDLFIRPIEYLVSLGEEDPSGKVKQILVLSPYEVNELMENFRNGEAATHLHMLSLRRSERQDLLLNEAKLILPRGVPPVVIPESLSSTAALLLASGNLYFGSMEEQLNFARFLCLAPQPRTKEDKRAFNNRLITKTGFMTPAYRKERNMTGEGFNKDPSGLLKMILMCRHPILNEMAHVVQLLNERSYAIIPGGGRAGN